MVAGARSTNEAILVTAAVSLPIRVTKQFESARKLARRIKYHHRGQGRPALGRRAIRRSGLVAPARPSFDACRPPAAPAPYWRLLAPAPAPGADGLAHPFPWAQPAPVAPSLVAEAA